MTRKHLVTLGASALAAAVLAGCSTAGASPNGAAAAQASASASGGGYTTSSDPQDVAPGKYPDRITNTSTQPGLQIATALVENNVDPVTQKPVSDHLELTIHNGATTPMTGFEIFYTVTDTATKQQESYDKVLTGLTLAAGETKAIHFDSRAGAGHFGINRNGLYYKSTNALDFSVKLSAKGFAPQTVAVSKAAGGAEKKD